MLLLGLVACGNNSVVENGIPQQEDETSSTSETLVEPPDGAESIEEARDDMSEAATTDIILTIDDITISATLDNSETTQEFLASLPRTLTMNRYGNREYYGRISPISENGERIDDFENGDVTYYPAGPSFAVFFAGDDRSSQGGLIRMGKITSDLSVFGTLDDTMEVQIDLK